jgi:hypothetical protein
MALAKNLALMMRVLFGAGKPDAAHAIRRGEHLRRRLG